MYNHTIHIKQDTSLGQLLTALAGTTWRYDNGIYYNGLIAFTQDATKLSQFKNYDKIGERTYIIFLS